MKHLPTKGIEASRLAPDQFPPPRSLSPFVRRWPTPARFLVVVVGLLGALLASCLEAPVHEPSFDGEEVPGALTPSSITWKGHTWQITSGGMAGVAPGSLNN